VAAFLDEWRPLFDQMIQDRGGILMRISECQDDADVEVLRVALARVDVAICNGAKYACLATAGIIAKAPDGYLPMDNFILSEPQPSGARDGATLN